MLPIAEHTFDLECKSEKDRMIPLSDKVVAMLQEYYKVYRPNVLLVQEPEPSEKYSETSLEQAYKAYKKLSWHLIICKYLAFFGKRTTPTKLWL